VKIGFLQFFLIFSFIFSSDSSIFDKGVIFYNSRSEGASGINALSTNIDSAIVSFTKLKDYKTFELDASIYLLKSYYFKGKYVVQDKNDKKKLFNKGKKLGEKLIINFPKSPGAYYWYLVNLGSWAEEYGKIAAAKEGTADLMREHAKKIIEIDNSYADGGGYFLLGAVHYKAPYIPFLLSWPNNKDAIKYLDLANKTGEQTASQIVYLAQSLHSEGDKASAKKLLNGLLKQDLHTSRVVEDLEQHQIAKEIIKVWN
jgi:TPR repeat protein